jgi:hypothetical protein
MRIGIANKPFFIRYVNILISVDISFLIYNHLIAISYS